MSSRKSCELLFQLLLVMFGVRAKPSCWSNGQLSDYFPVGRRRWSCWFWWSTQLHYSMQIFCQLTSAIWGDWAVSTPIHEFSSWLVGANFFFFECNINNKTSLYQLHMNKQIARHCKLAWIDRHQLQVYINNNNYTIEPVWSVRFFVTIIT